MEVSKIEYELSSSNYENSTNVSNNSYNIKKFGLLTKFTMNYYYLKFLFGFVITALLSAIIFFFLDYNEPKWRALYILIVVVIGWAVGYVDIVVIGFYPAFLGPMLGIASFDSLIGNYFSSVIMLFITASILGAALKITGLARRFAYFMMKGSSLESYDLTWRFYATGTLLSMWIADAPAMILVLPVLQQMLKIVEDYQSSIKDAGITDPRVFKPPKSRLNSRNTKVVTYLALAYGTCTGGMMTMIGSGSNFAFLEAWIADFGPDTRITFANWMLYGIPMGIVTGLFCWLAITISWEGPKLTFVLVMYMIKKFGYFITGKNPNKGIDNLEVFNSFKSKSISKLPPLNFGEKIVIFHFIITLLLLFLRDPGIPGFAGWDSLFSGGGFTHDALTTTISGIFLFVYPRYSYYEINDMLENDSFPTLEKRYELVKSRLLTWKDAQTTIEWGIIFILGGGFTMAAMIVDTGLVDVLAEGVTNLFEPLNEKAIVLLTLIITSTATEFMSGSILLQILSPVLNRVAIGMKMNPILLSYNAVFATVNGAVTPIATTSNVLATKTANLSLGDLMRTGLLFKVFAILVQYGCIYIYGYPLLDLGNFPQWAIDFAANQ